MLKKWVRVLLLLVICLALTLGNTSAAYAYYNDEEANEGVTVEEEPSPTPAPTTTPQQAEPVPQPQGQITPDGNLSLLDDLDYSARGGLQFMTVTTRSGHVYYIIIDRSSNSQNVYFLNQVDEYDLMSIMSDAEKAQYEQDQARPSNQSQYPQNVVPVQPEGNPAPTETPTQHSSQQSRIGSSLTMLAFFAVIGILIAIGFYFFKIKPKKEGADFDEEIDFEDDEEYVNEDVTDFDDASDEQGR